jgi:hypothetical protein
MPDQHGRLTAEDHQKIRDWWVGRWSVPVICPVCKTGNWGIGEHVVVLHRNGVDSYVPGTPSYQMILVYCKACSHTMFFNAVTMGILPPYNPAADPASSVLSQLLVPPETG